MKSAERSQSVWKATAAFGDGGPLTGHVEADVCVVGAGIAGLTTAYLLGRAGRRVVVLDKGSIGGGETAQTTAHLASALDDRFTEIERMHGRDGAAIAYASHANAIDRIQSIAEAEGIDCDFERLDGYLIVPPGQSTELLDRELAAAHRAGFIDATKEARAPLSAFDTGASLRFPRQGQFHPLKYLAGLARVLVERLGGVIHNDTHVAVFESGRRPRVRSRNGSVSADALVVATNTPVHARFAIHSKQAPYRTYVVGLQMAAHAEPPYLLWDTADPYHYVRQAQFEDHRVLIVGGEDHKTGEQNDAEARYARLERWARVRFPNTGERLFAWSGQVMEPVDGLAFIGRSPGDERVFLATGDSGHGMTHGTIAGVIISELIAGRSHPWARVYDPSRKTLRSAVEYAKDNASVVKHLSEHVRPAEEKSIDHIAPGQGAVVSRGGAKLAVYRDEQGVVHERSAVCTHLGCLVHFNREEKSWDCPCHGSRFSTTGEVLSGPARAALPPARDESAQAERRASASRRG